MIVQNSRIQNKFSTVTGILPTIPTTDDHTDGTWLDTDLYVGEIFINVADDLAWVRTNNGIIPITGATGAYIADYVSASAGGTYSGDVFGTSFEAPIIESTALINAVDINISGTATGGAFVGDGSGLTGIVATWNGGTVSLVSEFLSGVDFGSGILTDSIGPHTPGSINITSDVDLGANALDTTGNITASQFIGDGSLLTGITGSANDYTTGATLSGSVITFDRTDLVSAYSVDLSSIVGPSLSSVTWDWTTNLLKHTLSDATEIDVTINTFGDTTFNGTVTADFFVGDGSGLTGLVTVPGGLSDVLGYGNTTSGTNIVVSSNDEIQFGAGDGYGGLIGNNLTTNQSGIELGGDGTGITIGQYQEDIGDPDWGGVALNINNNSMTITETLVGNTPFAGVEYAIDYSANYTNRSLVDKEYVDGTTVTASNGLTKTSNTIKLGGALIENTTINTSTFNIDINDGTSKFLYTGISGKGGERSVSIGVNGEPFDGETEILPKTKTNFTYLGASDTLLLQQDNGIDNGYVRIQNQQGRFYAYNGVGIASTTSTITVSNDVTIASTDISFEGATYDLDYSANYTNRSLVDKEYVDGEITTAGVFVTGSGTSAIRNLGDNTNVASGSYAFTMGQSNTASGSFANIFGFGNTASGSYNSVNGRSNDASGDFVFIYGDANTGTTNTHTLGDGNNNTAQYGITVGINNTTSNIYGSSVGSNITNSGQYNFVSGRQHNNTSSYTGVFGRENTVDNSYGFAAGYLNTVGKSYVFGYNNSLATGIYSFAGGSNNTITTNYSTAFGNNNNVSNTYGVAMGNGNTASGLASVALGQANTVSGDYSSVFGRENLNTGDNNFISGYQNSGTTGVYSSILGRGNSTSSSYVFMAGYNNTAAGTGAVVIGTTNTVAGIYASTIGGLGNLANNSYATTIGGQNNTSSGQHSLSFGVSNTASGNYSVAGGFTNQATNSNSTAFGYLNQSTGPQSFSVNNTNLASGTNSFAINQLNKATGLNNFVGGYGSTGSAWGNFIHAYNSSVSANYSAILGGNGNTITEVNSAIIGGETNSVGGANSVIVGGTGLTNNKDNTVMVPYLLSNTVVEATTQFKAPTKINGVIAANTYAFDCNVGTAQVLDLQAATAASTLTFTNPMEGNTYNLIVIQGSGLYNLTLPTGWWIQDAAFNFTSLADNDRVQVKATYLDSTWYFDVKQLTSI